MGAFGANRRFATCGSCGHPLAAHIGGCYCGCRGRPTNTRPGPVASSSSGTNSGANARRRRRVIAKTSAAPPPKPPIEAFLEFVQYHFTGEQATQLLLRLANQRKVNVRANEKPWVQLRELVRDHYTQQEIEGYLRALRKRKEDGVPLIQWRRTPP